MEQEDWYSVRMRASQNNESNEKHISGGELLSRYDHLEKSVSFLTTKALQHTRGRADFMQIQVEKITEPILKTQPLKPTTHNVNTEEDGRALATQLLIKLGVTAIAIDRALSTLFTVGNMRGAMVVDAITGKRLDTEDDIKGIRVTRLGWDLEDFQHWCQQQNIPENIRTKEALTLASKVAAHPSTIAELCWSDDPEYITGYVASSKHGYERITHLKKAGDEQGCRIFFVKSDIDIQAYKTFLTKQPVMVQSSSRGENIHGEI